MHTLTHLDSYFCSSAVQCVLPDKRTWKKIPELLIHFSLNKSKPVSNPWFILTHPSSCLRWVSGILELSKGEPYTQVPWKQQIPSPHPGFISSWICTALCSPLWPALARDSSLFCLAEEHHTLQQGATGEEREWGRGSIRLAGQIQLFKWLCVQPREVPCPWGANSVAFGTSRHPACPNNLGQCSHSSEEPVSRSWATAWQHLSLHDQG